jgi:hypothetical protein
MQPLKLFCFTAISAGCKIDPEKNLLRRLGRKTLCTGYPGRFRSPDRNGNGRSRNRPQKQITLGKNFSIHGLKT